MPRLAAAAALLICLVTPYRAPAQGHHQDPSPGLRAAYALDGDAVDQVTGGRARAWAVRPAEGHDGRPGGALWFDGQRSFVDLGDDPAPEVFTVSAWIRPDPSPQPQVVVSRIRNLTTSQFRNLELRVNPDGHVFLHVPGGRAWDSVVSRTAIPWGRWTHVAATYDGARAQLWVNGARDGGALDVRFVQSRGPLFIGARPEGGGRRPSGPTFWFRGAIEDVRLWDRPLSEGELLRAAGRAPPPPPPPPRPELLARYPLDGDGRDAEGQSPGRLLGPDVRPAEDRLGNPGGALELGGHSWIDLGQRTEPEQLTLLVWVRPQRVDDDEAVIFSKLSDTRQFWARPLELRMERGGRLALQLPVAEREVVLRGAPRLAPGRWSLVVATFDGERAALWVDGALDAEGRFPSYEPGRGPTFLGARPDRDGSDPRPGSGWNGRLDDLQLFRGVLSPQDLAARWREGRPRDPDDDQGRAEGAFLTRVDRLVLRWDQACASGDAAALDEVERQIVRELEQGEDAARAEGNQGIAGYLRRASAELEQARGQRHPRALDRKRMAMARLAEALWGDLVRELPPEGIDPGRPSPPRRAGRWY